MNSPNKIELEPTKLIAVSNCPVCDKTGFSNYLDIKDYFLSQEKFNVSRCDNCGFLFTNPRPDEKGIQKYYQSDEYLSHSKDKKGILSSVYNIVRNYSIRKKYNLIVKLKPSGSILDIGCGTGEVLKHFSDNGWAVQGIEPAEKARNYAKNTLDLPVDNEEQLNQTKSNSFDVITLWHVLEHVPKLHERMKQINRILKDDGVLIVALPNHNSWDAQHFSSFWAAWDIPRHLYHFSQKTFSLLAQKHQFNLVDTLPMKFDAFYVSLLSEKYRTKKLSYFKALALGFKSNNWAKRHNNNYSSLIYVLKKDLS